MALSNSSFFQITLTFPKSFLSFSLSILLHISCSHSSSPSLSAFQRHDRSKFLPAASWLQALQPSKIEIEIVKLGLSIGDFFNVMSGDISRFHQISVVILEA